MPHTLLGADHDVEPQRSQEAERRWGPFALKVLVGWLLLLGGVTALGALVTGPMADSGFIQWDQQYPVDLENARTAAGESWSHVGSVMGDTLTVVGVAVVVGIMLLIARRWASVLLLATALLVEVSVFVASTLIVPRDRPDVQQLDVSPPTSSFPSGHTAAATALVLSLALLVSWNIRSAPLRWLAWALAVFVGPIVAFARVYRGMHHPTDVVVGLALGIGCVVVAALAVRSWVGAHRVDHAHSSAVLEERVQ
ncbi:MAG: phosphatase PAP2 family protein [Actinomycetia bacterium]|nr:phosphatase PAP2 family protein [Actinomycetes bacterium]